jgi:alginate O-acetyltransferase complex protein AlgI
MTAFAGYAVFLLLAVAGAFVRSPVPRQLLLLAASYAFYSTFGVTFLAVLIVSSVFNYCYGVFLQRNPTLKRLWGGIAGNVLLLGFFKTTHLAVSFAGSNSQLADFLSGVAMPLGISFWTFQALSYLFDIYRQEELDPSLLEFCLYMAFWPTVIMGPICRLANMLPQFRIAQDFSSTNLLFGTKRILTGLFLKLVISQTLVSGWTSGAGVAAGFEQNLAEYSGLDVWFLAIGFGFQLFFDFAGYSHVVIGAASIFGYRLEENFNSPFIASTPSEFWTRWHMSLSSWIRDYVFVPVSTIRREVWWRYSALLFSMTLFGLWHGAKSTFVLWGTYQGLLLVVHRVIQQFQRRRGIEISGVLANPLSWAVSFGAVSLGWILFRANDLGQAVAMFRAILSPQSYFRPVLAPDYYLLVLVVFLGYFGYTTLFSSVFNRIRTAITPDRAGKLANFGITEEFVTFVWLIPVVFVLFFSILIAHSGSEGVSPFAYSVF